MLLDHAAIPTQLPLEVEEGDAELLVVLEAVELVEVALVFVDTVDEGGELAPPQALTDHCIIDQK